MAKIKIGQMSRQIMKELNDYSIEVGLKVDKISKEVAQDSAKRLSQSSPKLTGDYAESWTYGVGDTKGKNGAKHSMLVHLEKPEYALSHLLENGHQNRNGGRTDAIAHIAPEEQTAIKELESRLKREL